MPVVFTTSPSPMNSAMHLAWHTLTMEVEPGLSPLMTETLAANFIQVYQAMSTHQVETIT